MEFLNELSHSTQQVSPILVLLGFGLLLMMLDAFKLRKGLGWITAAGLALAAIVAIATGSSTSDIVFSGMLETGGIAPLVTVFLCVSALLTLFFLQDYLDRQEKPIHDVYALLIFTVIGMILLANAGDLIMTFIGLETMSICLYIFAAFFKRDAKSNESGLKYFLLGAFASAFLLFGISLIYGLTGYTNLEEIAAHSESFQEMPLLFYTAAGLILIGFLFKISAFPFHNWTPDVYEGTPTPLAGFMATGSKMAAFVGLAVVAQKLFLVEFPKIGTLMAATALLTMIYGNIVAARQQNLKRMLAYSSIAHSGYVMLGLCAGSIGLTSIIFYMFIYTLMNIGAFGIVGMAERDYGDTNIDHWKGLGSKSPFIAGALSVFLFSLAGIPPLAGFMGKYHVFITAIRADLVLLATIGILTSVVGAYYYIRVIWLMYFGGDEQPQLNLDFRTLPLVGTAVLVFLILLFGVFPGMILEPIRAAADLFVPAAAMIP